MSRSAFFRDKTSSVSVMVAAAAIPLIGLVALAVDYGFWNQTKSQFEIAADTAALNATKIAANGIIGLNPPDSKWHAEAEAAARTWFVSALGKQNNFDFSRNLDLHIDVVRNGPAVTTTVRYSAIVPSPTGSFFGISQFPLSGQSSSTISLGGYTDITLLLDNSSSMLIGATAIDIAAMENYTPCSTESQNEGEPIDGDWIGPPPAACVSGAQPQAPCGFACHNEPNKGNSVADYDYLYLARNPSARPPGTSRLSVQLRYDAVQNAVKNVITTMEKDEVLADQFRLGVYQFNANFATVFRPSADLAQGLINVAAMSPLQVENSGDTNFPRAMAGVTKHIAQGGDGSTRETAAQNLFIVTDGIQDYYTKTKTGVVRTMGPVNPADCDAVKAKNVSVYVVYTTYMPLPYNPFYLNNIAQFFGQPSPNAVETALQACASSPANFYVATSPDQIDQALLAMLAASIRAPARFTM